METYSSIEFVRKIRKDYGIPDGVVIDVEVKELGGGAREIGKVSELVNGSMREVVKIDCELKKVCTMHAKEVNSE